MSSHAMVPLVERITTRYSPTEDRMRIAGELPGGQTVVLWMSQRLLQRLLPRLFQWLQEYGVTEDLLAQAAAPTVYADAIQRFAQQAAGQKLTPQPPVHTHAQTHQILVESVSLGASAPGIRLVFGGTGNAQPVGMVLGVQALRQWLIIVGRLWREAQWPPGIWPVWLQDSVAPQSPSAMNVLH